MQLLCYIKNEELRNVYEEKIKIHNEKINSGELFYNSGFDLYNPENMTILSSDTIMANKIDLEIVCAMFSDNNLPLPFYLYPRSSISKTPIRLANSVGIIDNNYRGNLIAMVNNITTIPFEILKHERYFQVCSANLEKFTVKLVNHLEDLQTTERGAGGFGSTGK